MEGLYANEFMMVGGAGPLNAPECREISWGRRILNLTNITRSTDHFRMLIFLIVVWLDLCDVFCIFCGL